MVNLRNGFYLNPLFEKRSATDCSCEVTEKRRTTKADFHKISIGRANLLHWIYHSDEAEIETPAHCAYHQHDCAEKQAAGILVSLNGPIMTVSDGHDVGSDFSNFHLFSPKERLHQHWGKDARVLSLTVPISACSELLAQSGITNAEENISLSPGISLPPHAKPLVVNIINNLTYCYERSSLGLPFQAMWEKRIEDITVIFLLQHLHSSFSNHTEHYQAYLEGHNAPQPAAGLEKLEDYLLKHLAEPIGLSDMVTISGYSRGYLHKLCMKHIGSSPMIWLRNLRLEAVDEHLKAEPDMNVTDVALLYGFGHMGRFSGYFHKRFGYHPSALKNG